MQTSIPSFSSLFLMLLSILKMKHIFLHFSLFRSYSFQSPSFPVSYFLFLSPACLLLHIIYFFFLLLFLSLSVFCFLCCCLLSFLLSSTFILYLCLLLYSLVLFSLSFVHLCVCFFVIIIIIIIIISFLSSCSSFLYLLPFNFLSAFTFFYIFLSLLFFLLQG